MCISPVASGAHINSPDIREILCAESGKGVEFRENDTTEGLSRLVVDRSGGLSSPYSYMHDLGKIPTSSAI
jgi:hypothetical protein